MNPSPKLMSAETSRKKRGAVDAFIAKDRVAVFWFLVACLVAGGCAWYVVVVSESVKKRPPFVIMDGAGVFYSAPGINFADAKPMHEALTRIAVETIFNRGPGGLINVERLPKLCTREGLSGIQKVIQEEAEFFLRQEVNQTCEIESIKVLGAAGAAAGTEARGRIIRRGQFGGAVEEISEFTVKFKWIMNPDVRGSAAFPARIVELFKYERIPVSTP